MLRLSSEGCPANATLASVKAWQLTATTGIGAYQLADIDEPAPGPGEVMVKLNASGLNHLDIWVANGLPAPAATVTDHYVIDDTSPGQRFYRLTR